LRELITGQHYIPFVIPVLFNEDFFVYMLNPFRLPARLRKIVTGIPDPVTIPIVQQL
jgi:hypothetical protein